MAVSLPARYRLIDELGRGGMGRVVKAHDTILNRLVAIKFVEMGSDSEISERLKREALAIAQLSHPNIVRIYDVLETSGAVGIVMEYISGTTIEKIIQTTPSTELVGLVPQLSPCADALDYAHRRAVIHRDIKPSNIMLGDDGSPTLLDFGIARMVSDRESRSTKAGFVLGTPLYMSPEQIEGGGRVGPWSDQYSFAVVLYHLLTGQLPFQAGDAVAALLYRILNEAVPRPGSLNPSLSRRTDQALLKALSKSPEDRFASCREMFDSVAGNAAAVSNAPGGLLGRINNWWANARETLGIDVKQAERARPAGEAARPGNSADAAGSRQSSLPSPPPPPRPPPRPGVTETRSNIPRAPFSDSPSTLSDSLQRPSSVSPMPPPPGPAADTAGEFTRMFRGPQTKLLRLPSGERVDAEDLAKAQARELMEILKRSDFESAVGLRGKWLPGLEGASGELLGFSEAARYLGAARDTVSPHIRIEHLKRAEKVLFSVGNQLLADTSPASRHLPEALEAWKAYARDLLATAQQKAAKELPNPFRAGQPLRPDQGRAVFRGRNELVRSIEAILADADQNSSLALLGPRRCGKTSALQMLPAMLPDCACVFFDLQDNAASSVAGFFDALVRRTREQVRAQRRLEIPGLEAGGPFEAATQWLDQLDALPGLNRVLISIDEFERLETLFPGDRRDLLRLMGMFRATIQHRHKVRLLVSGVAPFEELGPLWNDHFINVRELRIGHLDEDTSIDLLRRPIPEFPPDAVPQNVARLIFQRTAGQPYLLQLFGTLLINRLNEEERLIAQPEDVAAIEAEALTQGRYYFENTYQDAPVAQRELLESLARGESPSFTNATRRWLDRRCLIDEHGRLRIPVLGAFIREELGFAEPAS